MRFLLPRWLGLAIVVAAWPHVSSAGLVLSFDQSNYSIPGSGQTVVVSAMLSQIAGGPQVGPGNELLSAAIAITFNSPSGVAAVLSPSDITRGPVFDTASSSVTATSAILGETSLLGVGDLSNPLLIGTFRFTGLTEGAMPIQLASLGPGASFVTVGGATLDPTNTATATIDTVPEPSTIVLASLALLISGLVWQRKRHAYCSTMLVQLQPVVRHSRRRKHDGYEAQRSSSNLRDASRIATATLNWLLNI